ncbi:hypothetical protein BDM02DRAFT_1319862 [Thelephora ganbajun]|uniref:Uncharacterized protein n=1 Tax=Thelephora ganbajun TaxID=370292 RepID=A0ACB6Z256_THEGA|nr:hypothetical protein BDM02DRAFT_1319862 [Thelephora ganbajun]
MSSSKATTTTRINLDDIVAPIKNEISRPEDCKVEDMLRFLFSFCNTSGDTAEVIPKDKEPVVAFEKDRELANEPNTPLRKSLNLAIVAKDEDVMYSPLAKAFNYALDRLSRFQVLGLPKFQEDRQIVLIRSNAKYIESESHLQGSYKPDVVLVKRNLFRRASVHTCCLLKVLRIGLLL